jgi:hypothetical protein
VKSILRKLKTRNYLDLIDAITDAMLQVTKKIFITGLLIVATVPHDYRKRYNPLLSFSAKNNQERLEHKTFTKNPDFSHSVRK